MHILKSKPVLIFLALLLASITSLAAYNLTAQNNKSTSTNTAGLKGVDLEPASEADEKQVETHKEDLSRKVINENASSTVETKSAKPVITDASQYGSDIEVRAYVSGIIEETGTCKIIFTQGALQVTRDTPGLKDATTTRCSTLTIPRNEFQKAGSWNVLIMYSSPTATGSSKISTMEIK